MAALMQVQAGPAAYAGLPLQRCMRAGNCKDLITLTLPCA